MNESENNPPNPEPIASPGPSATPVPPPTAEPPPPPSVPDAAPAAPAAPPPATPFATPPPAAAGAPPNANQNQKQGGGCFKIGCLSCVVLLLVVCISVATTWWWITRKERFEPVVLTQPEQVVFDTKMKAIELVGQGPESPIALPPEVATDPTVNKPVVDEEEINRTIVITQRELNSLFHEESELGEQFKILLVRDGIDVKMSLQFPEDSPIMPGKNIRGKIGMYIALEEREFVVRIDSITLGGIPVPSAWLEAADLDTNTNLIEEFFGSAEVAEKFAAGIEKFEIKDGRLLLRLAE